MQVIEDRAATGRERVQRACAGDVGGERAEQRTARVRQHPRRMSERVVEIGVLSVDAARALRIARAVARERVESRGNRCPAR